MATAEEELILRLRAAGARTTARDVDAVGKSVSRTGKSAETASKRTSKFSSALNGTNKKMKAVSGGLKSAGSAFSALTFPIAGAAYASGKLAIDFDRSMRNVNSIAKLPEKNLNSLKRGILDMAGPVAQAPQTLADGLYDLVSSGFKGKQAMKILRQSAIAATAGMTDTATSTKAVAAVLNAYHQGAGQAKNVSDTLFQTVNRGVITFEELASTVGDALPFASSLGVSLKEVGAATATMTKAGIGAPETMTRIKNVMVAMLKPGDGLKGAFKSLGFESGEALIKAKGFQGALDALIGTTDGSKSSVAKLFPEIRAMGGALALTGKNSKGANRDLKSMQNSSGAAGAAFKEQSKSFAVQWDKFMATIKVLGIELGTSFLPALKDIAAWLGKVVKWFQTLSPGTRKWIVIIGLGIGVLGPFLIILGAVAAAGAALATTAGAIVLGIVAVIAIFTAAYAKFAWFRSIVAATWEMMKLTPVGIVISHFGQIVKFMASVPGAIKGAWLSVINFIIDRINDLIGATNSVIDGLNRVPGVNIGKIGEIGHVYDSGGSGNTASGSKHSRQRMGGAHLAAGTPYVDRAGVFDVGEKGRERVYLPTGSAVDPRPGEGESVIHTHVHLDGKEIAKSVTRHGQRAKAVA